MQTAKLNRIFIFNKSFKDLSYTADAFIFQRIKYYFLLPVGWRTETVLHDQEKVMGKITVGGHA